LTKNAKSKPVASPFDALKPLRDKLAAEAAPTKDKAPAKRAPAPTPKRPADPVEDELAFHRLMSGVVPLEDRGRRVAASKEDAPRVRPVAPAVDPSDAEVRDKLRELAFGASAFEVSDDGHHVEGRRTDVPPDLLRKLRRGLFPVDARMDLHGLTTAEAQPRLATFLREKRARGERCVLVIHGKGEHAPGGHGILRGEISAWLSQGPAKESVVAFATATAPDGGAGAVYVLLRR
jgi:DNA-nicking Smr family endonuclease